MCQSLRATYDGEPLRAAIFIVSPSFHLDRAHRTLEQRHRAARTQAPAALRLVSQVFFFLSESSDTESGSTPESCTLIKASFLCTAIVVTCLLQPCVCICVCLFAPAKACTACAYISTKQKKDVRFHRVSMESTRKDEEISTQRHRLTVTDTTCSRFRVSSLVGKKAVPVKTGEDR